jgi:hypothetical protein
MKHGGPPWATLIAGVGLYLLLTLKARTIWLPGGRSLTAKDNPIRYWSAVGLVSACLTAFVAYTFWPLIFPSS